MFGLNDNYSYPSPTLADNSVCVGSPNGGCDFDITLDQDNAEGWPERHVRRKSWHSLPPRPPNASAHSPTNSVRKFGSDLNRKRSHRRAVSDLSNTLTLELDSPEFDSRLLAIQEPQIRTELSDEDVFLERELLSGMTETDNAIPHGMDLVRDDARLDRDKRRSLDQGKVDFDARRDSNVEQAVDNNYLRVERKVPEDNNGENAVCQRSSPVSASSMDFDGSQGNSSPAKSDNSNGLDFHSQSFNINHGTVCVNSGRFRSVSMDDGILCDFDISLKEKGEASENAQTGGRRVKHRHGYSIDGSCSFDYNMESGSLEFDDADMKKILANHKLMEMAMVDPKRVKRILANRQSAARSKERKLKYMAELEHRIRYLQNELATLSAQLSMSQRDSDGLCAENNELKLRLQAMEQQSHLREALNLALREEIERLKLGLVREAPAGWELNSFETPMAHSIRYQPCSVPFS